MLKQVVSSLLKQVSMLLSCLHPGIRPEAIWSLVGEVRRKGYIFDVKKGYDITGRTCESI